MLTTTGAQQARPYTHAEMKAGRTSLHKRALQHSCNPERVSRSGDPPHHQHGLRRGQVRSAVLLPLAVLLVLLLGACLRQPAPPMGSLQALVLLEDGYPAAGAEVTLVRTDLTSEAGSGPNRVDITNDDGLVLFSSVLEGTYAITATLAAEPETELDASLATYLPGSVVKEGERTDATLVLQRASQLLGQVHLSDSAAAGGVLIELASTPLRTNSVASGAYELTTVPPGTFDVRYSAQGYATVITEGVVVAAEETLLLPDVVLQRVAPYASFTASVDGASVRVDARSSYDLSGPIVRYVWSMGDGTTYQGGSSAATLTHTYVSSGPKTITLTVVNSAGYSDTTGMVVQITLPVLQVGSGPYVRTLPAGTDGHFDVRVPVGAFGQVVYIEVQGAPSVQVAQGSGLFVSTSPGSFRRLQSGQMWLAHSDVASTSGDVPMPAAIGVVRACVGPCVLLPGGGGNATLTVHNPSATPRTVTIHLNSEPFSDLNEPNEVCSAATPVSAGTESGAIELVGDTDWFRVSTSGFLTFDAPVAVQLRAELFEANCTGPRTVSAGEPTWVSSGQLLRVRAVGDVAGPSGTTTYYLTLE